jgi:hypothetical protein
MYSGGQIRRPHFDATQEPELRLCQKQFWRITLGIYISAPGLIGSERICNLEVGLITERVAELSACACRLFDAAQRQTRGQALTK